MYQKEVFLTLLSLLQGDNGIGSRAAAGILHALGEINVKKMVDVLHDVKT